MPHKNTNVLVIDDEPPIRKILSISLESAGYNVLECGNGRDGIRTAAAHKPELILVDLGLPDIDGKEVISQIRQWSQVPILVCSVRHGDDEIIDCLSKGADDYITKPFNPDVVLARIHANLRKFTQSGQDEIELTNGSIRMDTMRHEVYLDGIKQVFTPKEYELLRYFLIHQGKMLTHRQILKDVWGSAHTEDMQYLRVYVRQLREKIEPDSTTPSYIHTEPGVGYRMESLPVPAGRAEQS